MKWAKIKSPLIVMKIGDLIEYMFIKKDLEFRQKNRTGSASAMGKTVSFFATRKSLGPVRVLNGFSRNFYGFLLLF